MPDDERRARGKEVLARLHGIDDPQEAIDGLRAKLGPEMADLTTDFCFGDLWSRPQLDRKTRSLIVIAACVAQGFEGPLAVHVRGALNHGATPEEVREVVLQMTGYAGFPAASSAAIVVESVLQDS